MCNYNRTETLIPFFLLKWIENIGQVFLRNFAFLGWSRFSPSIDKSPVMILAQRSFSTKNFRVAAIRMGTFSGAAKLSVVILAQAPFDTKNFRVFTAEMRAYTVPLFVVLGAEILLRNPIFAAAFLTTIFHSKLLVMSAA